LNFQDPQVLVNALAEKVFALTLSIDEIEAEDLPPSCDKYKVGLRNIVAALDSYQSEWIGYIENLYRNNPSKRDSELRAVAAIGLQIARSVHSKLLPNLRATTDQPPYLIRPMIARLIDAVAATTGSEIHFELLATNEFNYGFRGLINFASRIVTALPFPLPDIKLKHLQNVSGLPKWTVFLSYPYIENYSALNLTVISHEIAHLVDFTQEIYKPYLAVKLDDAAFNEYVERRFKTESSRKRVEVEADCFQVCNTVVESWLHEIVADVLATLVLGPAYLFSFLEFFAHGAMSNVPDDQHPSPAHRVEIILAELHSMGYLSGLPVSSELAAIEGRNSPQVSISKAGYADAQKVAHITLQQQLNKIAAGLRLHASSLRFDAIRYQREVPSIVDDLLHGIAPIERSRNSDLAPVANSVPAILNGGWEVKATKLSQFYSLYRGGIAPQKRLFELNQLIFKAVEAAEVIVRYQT
jgi:hypothetical protein